MAYISRVEYISHRRYFLQATDNSDLRRARLIIEIRVDEILAEQGHTFYWLAKQTGISHTTLWRLKKGKAFGLNLDTLEKMCRVLECQPGDILTLANQKKNGRNRRTRTKSK
jgi:putative transcriptional regulator